MKKKSTIIVVLTVLVTVLCSSLVYRHQRGIYYYNKGIECSNESNYSEAVCWYSKAAKFGNADAQNNLGLCYYNGESVDEDDSIAI